MYRRTGVILLRVVACAVLSPQTFRSMDRLDLLFQQVGVHRLAILAIFVSKTILEYHSALATLQRRSMVIKVQQIP